MNNEDKTILSMLSVLSSYQFAWFAVNLVSEPAEDVFVAGLLAVEQDARAIDARGNPDGSGGGGEQQEDAQRQLPEGHIVGQANHHHDGRGERNH